MDSVVRLKVENSEYDAKIKRAAQGLQHLEDACHKAGGTLAILDDADKKFVQSLGRMETVSKSARGRLGELSTAFTDLSVQYNRLTNEEKKGEYGKALSKSLEQIRQRAIDARKELDDINKSLGNVQTPNVGGFNLQGIAGGAMKFAGTLGIAMSAADAFRAAISNNISTAMEFEDSISKLSSLTGMVGKDLETLKGYAIELGGSTTQSASQVAQAFMLIGSQKPELLKNSEALKDVTKAAITLGEAANIDVTEAAKALTASLNIMGEGAGQASRYINVLAAGSKEGSVDIAGLTDIVYKAGQAATMNKMSFEQLVAVAEQIGPSFGSSAEAGTALNAMLLKLETQTNSKYKPSVVGLDEALKNLKDANLSASEATKLVTETGYKALVPLLQNVDAVGKLETAITGTTTAEDQARTNTDNLKGALANLDSAWERFNLTINDSNGALRVCVDWLTTAVNWMSDMAKNTDIATESLKRFNKENGGGDNSSFKNEKTRGQQIGAYNKRKHALDAEISKTQASVNAFDKGRNDTSRSELVRSQQETLYQASNKKLQALIEERRKLIEEGKRTFYPSSNTTSAVTPDPTPTTTSGKKGGKTTTTATPEPVKGSIAYLQKQMQDASKMINEAATDEARIAAQKLYNEYEAKIKHLKNLTKMEAEGPVTSAKIGVDVSSELNTKRGEKISIVQPNDLDTISGLTSEISVLKTMIEEFPQLISDEDLTRFDSLTSKLQEMKDNIPLTPAQQAAKAAEDNVKAWTSAANAIGSVGSALASIDDPAAKVAGLIAEAIATIAQTFAASLKGTFTPWDWIAGAAAGTATMISTIAAIKSATAGNYANGGIIPGNSYSGDNLRMYGVNSGEVVLNQAQTANLATKLQQAHDQPTQTTAMVDGEKVLIAINNYLGATGRGQIVVSRS